jgi:hypothetical protein
MKLAGLFARRSAALFVAVVLLVSHGTAALEIALVAHARCSHGELVHADRAHSELSLAPETTGDAAAFARSERTDAEGGDHDHCNALSHRYRPDMFRADVSTPLFASSVLSALRSKRLQVQPIPLLLLAPKSSPPRA